MVVSDWNKISILSLLVPSCSCSPPEAQAYVGRLRSTPLPNS